MRTEEPLITTGSIYGELTLDMELQEPSNYALLYVFYYILSICS